MSMTVNSMTNDQLAKNLMKLSSMQRINSASDDAAGLAISKKLEELVNGLNQGSNNAADMSNLLNTADEGLDSISDNLQRIRELSVQASNGTYTDSDKKIMQQEVDQLLGGIKQATQGTEFNTMKLLDGSFADKNLASNPSGNGMKINIEDTSLQTLGIDDYNITGSFDISKIDKALESVLDARAKVGAQYNGIQSTIKYNDVSAVNQEIAKSRISDLDFTKELTQLNTNKALEQYKFFAQKSSTQNQSNKVLALLNEFWV